MCQDSSPRYAKGRLRASAKGDLVRPDKMLGAHDKKSVRDVLG